MHGNLWEWCHDRWNDNYDYCRAALRGYYSPGRRGLSTGFRPALSLQ